VTRRYAITLASVETAIATALLGFILTPVAFFGGARIFTLISVLAYY
jgi:hypothetical protein